MIEIQPGSIVALIPAFNEEKKIAQVVQATAQHLPVLVVDDGSRDHTAASAEAAGAQVIRQVPNQGKGAALKNGFQAALQGGAAAVLTLDADGQHDPAEIPAFLENYKRTQADLIIGARDFSQMPFSRHLANTFGRGMFSWAIGRKIRDNQSGYRLISARLAQACLESREAGFEFEVEMVVLCVERGWALEWVPIRTIYADEKSHIHPLKHIREFTRVVMQTRKRMKAK